MKPILFTFPGNENFSHSLIKKLQVEKGKVSLRHFPDGETYVRFRQDVKGKKIVLVCTLEYPDYKIIPLLFLAETARELGALQVGLVAPYLAYMRQDKRFLKGEGVTSRYFAKMISGYFDWMVTVDPHLHRIHKLGDIYFIPTRVVPAAPAISTWIKKTIRKPILIGPDEESEQWVSEIASGAISPYVILRKKRKGDRNVVIKSSGLEQWQNHTPILIDDIISTGQTMIETVRQIKKAGLRSPVCIGVHALLKKQTVLELKKAGAQQVITCNTISHPTNRIDLSSDMASTIKMVW